MRYIFTLLLIFVITSLATAQISINSGYYTDQSGRYTITVSQDIENKTFTIIEPISATGQPKKSVYTYMSGNEYRTENNGIRYRVSIINNKSWKSYHPETPNNPSLFYYSGEATGPAQEERIDYKKLAEDYKDKMKTDPANVQANAFCAAAAMARASYNAEGFEEYCKKIVMSLKLIVVNKDKCPCEDVIPKTIWDSVKIE